VIRLGGVNGQQVGSEYVEKLWMLIGTALLFAFAKGRVPKAGGLGSFVNREFR
jgi:hypothetical protein